MKDWQRIEAVLFGSGKYLSEEQIVHLSGVPKTKLKSALSELKKHYESINSSLDIFKENDSWKLNVKEEFSHIAKNVISEAEMSKPVMETLALIAYKSPVFQSEIIDMRGAGAYDYISLLEEKGFITKEKSGRTYKLKTAPKFYDYFDISGDSKLRELFKGVKKPDSLGNLEVYKQDHNGEQEKDKEFSDKILERMKKVEAAPSDYEEKKKFLDGFDDKFSKTKSRIDETDREMNEFRRVPPAEDNEGRELQEGEEKPEEHKIAESKFNDPDRHRIDEETENDEKNSSEQDTKFEENFSESALRKLEKALEGLDSPKENIEEKEDEEEEGVLADDGSNEEEQEEEKEELQIQTLKVSPYKLQKIKDQEINKLNRKAQAKEEKKENKPEAKHKLEKKTHNKKKK